MWCGARDRQIDYLVLHEGEYQHAAPDAAGIIRSEVFPGLWLNGGALLSGDLAAVSDAVRGGAALPEHAAFVQRLNTHAK
jgi:hypothetical protein